MARANPEVFDTKTECEEELNNSLTRGYEKIENIGSEQVFYKRAIGDFIKSNMHVFGRS